MVSQNRSSTLCQLNYNGYVYDLGVRYDGSTLKTEYYLNQGVNRKSIDMTYIDSSTFTSMHDVEKTCNEIYFVKKYNDDTDFNGGYTDEATKENFLSYYNANDAIEDALSEMIKMETETEINVDIKDVAIIRLNTWGIPIAGGRVFFDTGSVHDDSSKSPLGQSLTGILMHIPGHMVVGEKGITIPKITSSAVLEEPDTTIEE